MDRDRAESDMGKTERQNLRVRQLLDCADVFLNAHYDTWSIHYTGNARHLLTSQTGNQATFS